MIIGYILQNPQKKISAVKTFFVDEHMVKTLDWKSKFKPRQNFEKYHKAARSVYSSNARVKLSSSQMEKSAVIFFIMIQFKQFFRRNVFMCFSFYDCSEPKPQLDSFNSFKEFLFGLPLTLTYGYMHLKTKLCPTLLFMTFFITPSLLVYN